MQHIMSNPKIFPIQHYDSKINSYENNKDDDQIISQIKGS